MQAVQFFEPPPQPPEPPRRRLRIVEADLLWMGPPVNVIGGVVPVRVVLARSETAAVLVIDVAAYRSGFSFTLRALVRDATTPHDERRGLLDGFFGHSYRGGVATDEFLRLGVEFPDGSKATNLENPHSTHWGRAEPPPAPVLNSHGGHGGGGTYELEYSVWPLPPPGTLAFACQWPACGIDLTRVELDTALLRAAAERARLLWGDSDERPQFGGFGTFGDGESVDQEDA